MSSFIAYQYDFNIYFIFIFTIGFALWITFSVHSDVIHKALGLLLLSIITVFFWIVETYFIFVLIVYILAFIGAVLMLFLSVVIILPITITHSKSKINLVIIIFLFQNNIFFQKVQHHSWLFYLLLLFVGYFLCKFLYVFLTKYKLIYFLVIKIPPKHPIFYTIILFIIHFFFYYCRLFASFFSSYFLYFINYVEYDFIQNYRYDLPYIVRYMYTWSVYFHYHYIIYIKGVDVNFKIKRYGHYIRAITEFKLHPAEFNIFEKRPLIKNIWWNINKDSFILSSIQKDALWLHDKSSYQALFTVDYLKVFFLAPLVYLKSFIFKWNIFQYFNLFEFLVQFFIYINLLLIVWPANNHILWIKKYNVFNDLVLSQIDGGLYNIKFLLYEQHNLFLLISMFVLLVALLGSAIFFNNKA